MDDRRWTMDDGRFFIYVRGYCIAFRRHSMPEGGPTPTVKTANLDGAGRPPAPGPQARIPFGARLGSGLRTESAKRFQGLWDSPLLTRAHDARGGETWLTLRLLVCVRINDVSRTSEMQLILTARHKKTGCRVNSIPLRLNGVKGVLAAQNSAGARCAQA